MDTLQSDGGAVKSPIIAAERRTGELCHTYRARTRVRFAARTSDRVYIQNEIAAHRAVLDLAKKAHDQAQNEELKKLIEQAQPVIERHLQMAEDIQKKLGGPRA